MLARIDQITNEASFDHSSSQILFGVRIGELQSVKFDTPISCTTIKIKSVFSILQVWQDGCCQVPPERGPLQS